MANRVSIIGSFRKHHSIVIELIHMFRNEGLFITSPKDSEIINSIDDFVIFASDNQAYTPEEIQMITLEKILGSEAVFVCNPEGYVGRTTCYEIGVCLNKFMPIYYLKKPVDLPIPVNEDHIVSPKEFISIVLSDQQTFTTDYKLCTQATKAFNNIWGLTATEVGIAQQVVICGSMTFYDDMVRCQEFLSEHNVHSIIPKEEGELITLLNEKSFREFKKKVSRNYLKKIRDKNTYAVLVYNEKKNGIANYIGANTLVELAMAFTWNREIYLFDDVYEPLADELLAWDCVCLKRNLLLLVDLIKQKTILSNVLPQISQLSLFDQD